MEKLFTRMFGVVWIGMIIFLSFIIAERPSESGIAISFLIVSIGMTYFHFSGQFDPEKHRPRLPPSVAEAVFYTLRPMTMFILILTSAPGTIEFIFIFRRISN